MRALGFFNGSSRGSGVQPSASKPWGSKSVRVGPRQPSTARSQHRPVNQQLSFTEAFGVLGPPMLLVLLTCITWTSWLVLLACAPTWTANYLMNTEDLDDGNFWLIVDTEMRMKALSLTGLALVALSYTHVLLKMAIWRNRSLNLSARFTSSRIGKTWSQLPLQWRFRKLLASWGDLTSFHGSKRKLWVRY